VEQGGVQIRCGGGAEQGGAWSRGGSAWSMEPSGDGTRCREPGGAGARRRSRADLGKKKEKNRVERGRVHFVNLIGLTLGSIVPRHPDIGVYLSEIVLVRFNSTISAHWYEFAQNR
jgi:hypothetical protein